MTGSGAATGPLTVPTAKIVCSLVVAAFVLIPVGLYVYLMHWEHRWDGDVPAVVANVHDRGTAPFYTVEFPGALPTDAMHPDLDHDEVVSEMLARAGRGERVTCHVQQTYVAGRDMAIGPRTTVTHCWR